MDKLVTVSEAVEKTGYSRAWVVWLATNGHIPGERRPVGGLTLWYVDLQALLDYQQSIVDLERSGTSRHDPTNKILVDRVPVP